MKILVTGCAGFIGFSLSRKLIERGDEVFGVDNLSPYYDIKLKESRLKLLESHSQFSFSKIDITDRATIEKAFREFHPDRVVHLAAQAGVRYSLENPYAYIDANLKGFINILEACRHRPVEHLVYASSSSVYGANTKTPFSPHDLVDHPVSLYAATKKANELMAHSYSHLYQLPTTGLRFFTVYGPWGRPDMALFLFTRNILEGKPIDVFNYGKHRRDFTYIDDVIFAVTLTLDRPPLPDTTWNPADPDPATSNAPYRIYNIGNSSPALLGDFIEEIEKAVGKKAKKNLLPLALGDVPETFCDISDFEKEFAFRPRTPLREGVERFVAWFREYYHL